MVLPRFISKYHLSNQLHSIRFVTPFYVHIYSETPN